MTDKIPASVLKEARRISFEIGKPGDGLSTQTIAIALLARDQRAAEIALEHGENSLDGQYWAGVNQAAVSISNAILSYDEAQK